MKMMEMTETMDTVDCWRTSVESLVEYDTGVAVVALCGGCVKGGLERAPYEFPYSNIYYNIRILRILIFYDFPGQKGKS